MRAILGSRRFDTFPSEAIPRLTAPRTRLAAAALLLGDALVFAAVIVMVILAEQHLADNSRLLGLRALPGAKPTGSTGWGTALIVLALGVVSCRRGHYGRALSWVNEAFRLLVAVCAGLIGANILTLLASGGFLPPMVQLAWLLCVPALMLERTLIRTALDRFVTRVEPMFEAGDKLNNSVATAMKRGFDIFASVVLLVFLSPLLLVIAAFVQADGGSALYAHARIGRGGRRFRCLKFRTMVPDAELRLRELLSSDPAAAAEWAQAHKLAADPRVTGIGMFLRQTSLDELPQLLNVLIGDMSLVGPRPIVEAEVWRYGDDIVAYYAVRPGITGLWQVSGRSQTTYDRRVQLDVSYVKNWSLSQDFSILLKTIPAVLLRQGAA